MPPVCKFYIFGCCKFGSNCRNKHEVVRPDHYHLQPPNYQQNSSRISRPQFLSLPQSKDNLSRDFRFVVPSPTVDREKIVYSSDSDWDDHDLDNHLETVSNLAIVACHKCGFKELKQQPSKNQLSLCLKCKDKGKGDIRDFVDDDDAIVKKKKKRKKRKSPILNVKIFEDEYQSTPEGVRVYRKQEENLLESKGFAENLESSKVSMSKDKIIMTNKSKSVEILEESTLSCSLSSNVEIISEIGDKSNDEVMTNSSSLVIANDLMISVNYLLPKLGHCLLFLCQFLHFFQNCLVRTAILCKNIMTESVQDWCSTVYRQLTGAKTTKYSRRRKIRN